MSLKHDLIRLAKVNPELRPHVREVLAILDREAASPGSLASAHETFVHTVRATLERLMRGTSLNMDLLRIQSNLSVVTGRATLIYQYGRDMADELVFSPSASPKVVAQKLAQRLERDYA